jgi:predicted nucleotidyltransferase
MRVIPDTMDAGTVESIDGRLREVEASERVTIAWAIESGSRAWGFPSPDSDYDCRFFFVRSAGDYLSPWPRRDVIETPLDKVFDVNGWDLAKALRLLVKGNGTVGEWLRSPIVYSGDREFRDDFLATAEGVADRALLGRHYLHVGKRQRALESGSLKRFFYALRPAAVLRWMRTNPERTVPPMNLIEALAEGDAPAAVLDATHALIEQKRVTRELGTAEAPAVLRQFVDRELEIADGFESAQRGDIEAARRECEAFFERALGRWGS